MPYNITQGPAALNQWARYTESFKLLLAFSPKNHQLLIRLLSSVMRKCFIQGRFGHAEIHATSQRPIASRVIQSVRLCVMIFPDSWLARFAHVTPQISPDNTLRHSGWSHSPDLAAPANSEVERRKTFLLICSICWKRKDSLTHTLSVAPIDFEPFVLLRQWIASQGLLKSCTQSLQMQLAIMNWRNMKSLKDVTDSSALFRTMLSCCHICVVL